MRLLLATLARRCCRADVAESGRAAVRIEPRAGARRIGSAARLHGLRDVPRSGGPRSVSPASACPGSLGCSSTGRTGSTRATSAAVDGIARSPRRRARCSTSARVLPAVHGGRQARRRTPCVAASSSRRVDLARACSSGWADGVGAGTADHCRAVRRTRSLPAELGRAGWSRQLHDPIRRSRRRRRRVAAARRGRCSTARSIRLDFAWPERQACAVEADGRAAGTPTTADFERDLRPAATGHQPPSGVDATYRFGWTDVTQRRRDRAGRACRVLGAIRSRRRPRELVVADATTPMWPARADGRASVVASVEPVHGGLGARR